MSFVDKLNWRYATKKFSNQKVVSEIIDKILEATRMAPSSRGLQPYHVTVITDPALKSLLKPEARDQNQIDSCSHLLVFSARTDTDQIIDGYVKLAAKSGISIDRDKLQKTAEKGIDWASEQVHIALGFALVACLELGVDSCPMGGFDPVGFKKVLSLPEFLEPKVLLTIGYRDPNDVVKPKIRFGKEELFDFR